MALSAKQWGVVRGIALGLTVTAGTLLGVSLIDFPWFHEPAPLTLRLQLATSLSLIPILCLAVVIGLLARHRFFSPQDIDGSGLTQGTAEALRLQAVIQNTLEQAALAIPAYLAWCLLMPARWLLIAAGAAFLFLLGRLLFAQGYARGAPGRALGFALTFYPSIALLIIMIGERIAILI